MGGILTTIGSIAGGGVKDLVLGVLDRIKLAPEKKAEVELAMANNALELQKLDFELQKKQQDYEQSVTESQKAIIVAEMSQGDAYTKRARPTIVYAGLVFVILNYIVPTYMGFFANKAVPEVPIPADFWWVWGGVCGTWIVGRSMERRGIGMSKTTKSLTGV